MKKFKGFIGTEEGSYDYFRTKLKKYGASRIKGKVPEGEYEFYHVYLTFRASSAVVHRLLLDEELLDKVIFKDFPMSKLVKLSRFNNMKIIQHSEFKPMLHYHADSRIGWHAELNISIYLAIYSQNKTNWDKTLKESGFANAEYIYIDDYKIRLYGYSTIHELYPYMVRIRDIDFRPTYYLDKTNIIQTLPAQFLINFLHTHSDIAFYTFGQNLFTQLLDEQIKVNRSNNIPELMKKFNQSENYDSNKCEFSMIVSHPIRNKIGKIYFPKNISHLLITMQFVELTYEDTKEERFFFSSKRLHTDLTYKYGKPSIFIEYFAAMEILQSISMDFMQPL